MWSNKLPVAKKFKNYQPVVKSVNIYASRFDSAQGQNWLLLLTSDDLLVEVHFHQRFEMFK